MRSHRQRLTGDRGAVAVEFALIFTVLALILFGILEFGRVWSQVQAFQAASREGARCAALKSSGVTTCDIRTTIVDAATPYTPSFVTSATDPSVTVGGVSRYPTGCLTTDRGNAVIVSWGQTLHIDIPFWSEFTFTKTISGEFRCE